MRHCRSEFPNIVHIVVNGHRRIYIPGVQQFTVKGHLLVANEFNTFTYPKDVILKELLQWLKNNGGVARFPNHWISSGDMSSRSANFTSLDYGWHITREYYRTSNVSKSKTVAQALRILGVNMPGDTTPRILDTTDVIFADMLKAHNLLNKYLSNNTTESAEPVFDNVRAWTVRADDLPDRAIGRRKNPMQKLDGAGPHDEEGVLKYVVEAQCAPREVDVVRRTIEFLTRE
jgi:hypothetical protein